MRNNVWTYSEGAKTLFCGERVFAVVTAPDGNPLDRKQQETLLSGLKLASLMPTVEAVTHDLEVCATSDSLDVAEVCSDWAKRLRRALRCLRRDVRP